LIFEVSFQEVKSNPNNYDGWFDYLRLVESEGDLEVIRETYERAIANVPPTKVSELMLFIFK
jgi:crooked neck